MGRLRRRVGVGNGSQKQTTITRSRLTRRTLLPQTLSPHPGTQIATIRVRALPRTWRDIYRGNVRTSCGRVILARTGPPGGRISPPAVGSRPHPQRLLPRAGAGRGRGRRATEPSLSDLCTRNLLCLSWSNRPSPTKTPVWLLFGSFTPSVSTTWTSSNSEHSSGTACTLSSGQSPRNGAGWRTTL